MANLEYYASARWAVAEPGVILLGKFDRAIQQLIVLKEFYQAGARFHHMVDKIKEFNQENTLERIFCPEKPEQFIRRFAGEDLPVWPLAYNEEMEKVAVSLTAEALERMIPDKGPGLAFSRECTETIRQFAAYRVKVSDPNRPVIDRPQRVHHQTVEALHLLVLGLFNSPDYQVRWI